MKLSLEDENGKAVRVALSGTVAEATPTDNPMKALTITDIYAREILLDMQDVKMLNSHGIGWLLRTHKLCDDAGGRLVLHSVPQMARNVLRMMKLHQLLNIAANHDEAEGMCHGEAE